jgi:IMP dehydrogenase
MNYDSYRLEPQYCEIYSRADVDTQIWIRGSHKLTCPVIPANMSFCESAMCNAVYQTGAIGALHRFMSIEENVNQYLKVKKAGNDCFVSIGVNSDSKERMQELHKAGAKLVMIDIAHGDSIMMQDTVRWLSGKYADLFIVGGNIGTVEAAGRLFKWGCNGVKVGLSHGQVCTTRDVTGVSAGSVELLQEITKFRDNMFPNNFVIADGGVRCIGDVCKSIAIGCDLVMSGYLFSKCYESATHGKYYGNASAIAMKKVKDENSYMPTPEGREISVETQYHADDLVRQIEGGLRSAMTYSNAINLHDFKVKAKLVKVDK